MMSELQVTSTRFTPLVKIDLDKRQVEVRGRSIGNEKECIYNPLVSWINENPTFASEIEVINFYLDYTSAKTVRCIFSVLLLLKNYSKNSVVVNWYYNVLDDSTKETVEDLIPLVPFKFNIIAEEF